MKKLVSFIAVLMISSCCKVKIEFESIKKISFVNFSISEVDTFYVLPIIKDSVINFSDYYLFQETTTNLSTTLIKNSLKPFSQIEIVLKDTSKRFIIDSIFSHTEKLGEGRCAGSITKIDGYKINGIVKPLNYIEVVK
jgi:hypothetical protein